MNSTLDFANPPDCEQKRNGKYSLLNETNFLRQKTQPTLLTVSRTNNPPHAYTIPSLSQQHATPVTWLCASFAHRSTSPPPIYSAFLKIFPAVFSHRAAFFFFYIIRSHIHLLGAGRRPRSNYSIFPTPRDSVFIWRACAPLHFSTECPVWWPRNVVVVVVAVKGEKNLVPFCVRFFFY